MGMAEKITSLRIREDLNTSLLLLKIKHKLKSVEDVIKILYKTIDEKKFETEVKLLFGAQSNDVVMERKELIAILVEQYNFDITLITDSVSNNQLKNAIKECEKNHKKN